MFPTQKSFMPNGRFKPGERAISTGIYTATHHQHRKPHEVLVVEGEQFPKCRKCGIQVRFELLHTATDIKSDRDFGKTEDPPSKKARSGRRQN